MKRINWKSTLSRTGRALKAGVTHNIGLKALSLIFALMLWCYVITADPNITRDIVLNDIDVSVSGQSVLSSRSLALLTDLSEALGPVNVRVTVPQASYALVSDTNIRVEMDLTNVRTTGKQRITFTGTSVYGEVVQIWPEYIDVEVEELDQRYIPVNVELTGGDLSSYWYATRANPTQVMVSGPTSVVRTVSSALIALDVTDITAPTSRAEQFTLIDSLGDEIGLKLTKSTSSVTVGLDVYPVKSIALYASPEEILTGTLATGYEIKSVTISPETVFIAGESALLDSITGLTTGKIDVSGRTSSFSTRVTINAVNGLKNMSTNQVTVSVSIAEIDTARRFQEVPVTLVSQSEEQTDAVCDVEVVSIVVTGPYSAVESIVVEDVIATVDITGLDAGEYELPVYVTVDNRPGLECTATPATVTVTVK